MSENRPIDLTIAGFDPSGGAGVLADIKTFEQHKVYGFAINTANTIQTENVFHKIQWTAIDFVLESITTLLNSYAISAVKIGIVPSLDYLKQIVFCLKKHSPSIKIIWDPILKSSTEFDFLSIENQETLIEILQQIVLITPNYNEIKHFNPEEKDPQKIAKFFSTYCSILLKGGHNSDEIGVDYLFTTNNIYTYLPKTIECYEKHGSGCVLSSAITANLALGQNLQTACGNAKTYTEKYLLSNPTKLGFHHV
ncbi:hydroxymethylpyrimidine/phosphomethylpyrimidine kinase [Flavobacterium sp. M31R6]|uniref:hydroxymethylpyrimidine/phosphomethylpyrimidine kinase n=1 Tax=Flavobacterium sp. M31R6 TaxID=2739062 RepID=UPI0015682B0F|nr:hydroxymethylpyrimidine/phosphomethylpyrimidine kinase [Flavobacterium sp. M31R6]QKJ62419.1 hydroxymethylpyrimidine/phosphomethylpyrimidine kinase [Flavobacterium sp. M31R6]